MKRREFKERIEDIVKGIREHFSPRKIVLFGSWVWGSAGEDSDIDIFVIMESALRRDERGKEIRRLFPAREYGLDVIVYTPVEVEESIKRGNFFIREILEKGEVVWEG